jgi:hypothetical protein
MRDGMKKAEMSDYDWDAVTFRAVQQPKSSTLVKPQSLEYIHTLLKIQTHVPKCIDAQKAEEIFQTLRTKIDWRDREGLPQFNHFVPQFPELSKYMDEQVEKLRKTYPIPTSRMATIVTFLPDGNYDVWDHYHPGQCEVKFSFGGSRPVIVNDTEYLMSAGDVIMFGPLHHSVPPHKNSGEQINIVTYFTDKAHNINL